MAAIVSMALSSRGLWSEEGLSWASSILEEENAMRYDRQRWCWAGVFLGTLVLLTGCAYDATVRQLSLAEQAEWHLYKKVMTPTQARAYVAKASAAERTAYLREVGLAQRFEALDPLDRAAVQSGFPRVGMSAEALRFVWGEPDYTEGDARRSAHWHYRGSSLALGASGNQPSTVGSRVDVYLVAGQIMGWVDYAPSTDEQDDWGSQ
jgi:hypothetical protein